MSSDLREALQRAGSVPRRGLDLNRVLERGGQIRFRKRLMGGIAIAALIGLVGVAVARVHPSPVREREAPPAGSVPSALSDVVAFAKAPPKAHASDIYVMGLDGSGLVNLTETPSFDFYPSWSGDGSRLAFVSTRAKDNDETDIYVMNSDGSNVQRVTTDPAIDAAPAMSPGGDKIAFMRNLNGQDEIFTVNTDGSGEQRLTHNTQIDGQPAWSPDGTKLAFIRNVDGIVDLYVMKEDGTGIVRLTAGLEVETSPQWSPNGEEIAFVRSDPNSAMGDIYLTRPGGRHEYQVTRLSQHLTSLSWVDQGRRIVFLEGGGEPNSSARLRMVNADGTGLQRLRTFQQDIQNAAAR